jgi:hypothetical protein
MADSRIQVGTSTDYLGTSTVVNGVAQTVHVEWIIPADPTTGTEGQVATAVPAAGAPGLVVRQAGTADVNIVGGGGSGGTASNFGSAFPAVGTAVGFSDGTNMVTVRASSSAPAGTEVGVITRNIPSGTQTVSGSVNLSTTALTANAPAAATVGTSSATALALNASRKGAHFRNTSTSGQTISIAFSGGTAVLNSGVTLFVGDAFDFDQYSFTTGAVTAIASAASARLSVQEWQ